MEHNSNDGAHIQVLHTRGKQFGNIILIMIQQLQDMPHPTNTQNITKHTHTHTAHNCSLPHCMTSHFDKNPNLTGTQRQPENQESCL